MLVTKKGGLYVHMIDRDHTPYVCMYVPRQYVAAISRLLFFFSVRTF